MGAEADMIVEQPRLPPGPLSYEEFLERCPSDVHAEWIDGYAILLHVTVKLRHDLIVGFLRTLLSLVGGIGGLGTAHGEPFLMYLPKLGRSRAPDVFFVLSQHRDRLREHDLVGPADIVVEVLSPGSEARDRVDKLAEYEAAGVPEYWLVDGERQHAEFRRLGPDGRYQIVLAGASGDYQSTVLPGLRLRVEWLWQEEPGNNLSEVLRTLRLR